MSAARAVEIVKDVERLLKELNTLTKDIPLKDRVTHDIFEYYFFGCAGGPGGVAKEIIPTVPKIPTWPDRPVGNTWEFSRVGMRNRGTPERMIWELYPAQNPAERQEMERRVRESDAKVQGSAEDRILQRAARFAANRAKCSPEELLANPDWVAAQRELQRVIKNVKVLY